MCSKVFKYTFKTPCLHLFCYSRIMVFLCILCNKLCKPIIQSSLLHQYLIVGVKDLSISIPPITCCSSYFCVSVRLTDPGNRRFISVHCLTMSVSHLLLNAQHHKTTNILESYDSLPHCGQKNRRKKRPKEHVWVPMVHFHWVSPIYQSFYSSPIDSPTKREPSV